MTLYTPNIWRLKPQLMWGVIRQRLLLPDGRWIAMIPGMHVIPGSVPITTVTYTITSSQYIEIPAHNSIRGKATGGGAGGGGGGINSNGRASTAGSTTLHSPTPLIGGGAQGGEGYSGGRDAGNGGTWSGPVGATGANGTAGQNGDSSPQMGGRGGAAALGGGTGGSASFGGKSGSNGNYPGGGGGGGVASGPGGGGGGGGGGAAEYLFGAGVLGTVGDNVYCQIGQGTSGASGWNNGGSGRRGEIELEVN